MNATFIEKLSGSFTYLRDAGPNEIFKVIDKIPQFPFFFIIQALWCCYIVKKSYNLSQKPKDSLRKKLIKTILCFLVAFVMTFASRELVSIITKKGKSPIVLHPTQVPVFIIIFALINFVPYDIFFKIVDVLYYFLGLMQGYNQMRLFLRVINLLKKNNLYQTGFQNYIIATTAIIFEYVVECSMRRIIRTAKTNVSNGKEIIRTIIICLVYVCALNADLIKPYIIKNHLAEVIFGTSLGIFNAAVILY